MLRRMREEDQGALLPGGVDEGLGEGSQRSQFPLEAEDQGMVDLGMATWVVDLLADQKQDSSIVSLESLHPDVVIRHRHPV
jgi:hypothetical protein